MRPSGTAWRALLSLTTSASSGRCAGRSTDDSYSGAVLFDAALLRVVWPMKKQRLVSRPVPCGKMRNFGLMSAFEQASVHVPAIETGVHDILPIIVARPSPAYRGSLNGWPELIATGNAD